MPPFEDATRPRLYLSMNHPGKDELAARLDVIERDIDSGRYRPGPWGAFIRLTKEQPDSTRAALIDDISRVSRKLHMRSPRRTVALATAITVELVATALGGILLAVGLNADYNSAAVAAMIIWVITFQPLVKVAAGTMLGIGYEYGYLYGIEPRFKMKFGNFVAAPRWKRVVLHASGLVGSPLAALVVASIADGTLPVARSLSMAVFWIAAAINLVPLILALLGVRRLGHFSLADGSAGSMALELREAIGGSRIETK